MPVEALRSPGWGIPCSIWYQSRLTAWLLGQAEENGVELLDDVEGLLAKVREALPLRGDSSRRNVREARRVRLSASLGSELVGVCYVLDEPTVGLHPRDIDQLAGALEDLRDAGNRVNRK